MGMQNIEEESSKSNENRLMIDMHAWLLYKAPAKERQKKIKYNQISICRICGKQTTEKKICHSCDAYIKHMKARENPS